jgi:hypothetical protein
VPETPVVPETPEVPAGGGQGPGNGTNPEANNTSPGTSGTGTDGSTDGTTGGPGTNNGIIPEGPVTTSKAINLTDGGNADGGSTEGQGSDFSEGSRSPINSSVLASAAGLAAAAGLGLTGIGSRIGAGLLRFLAGSSVGLFLIGLFRRDRRPGQPENFVIFPAGPVTTLEWTASATGKAPDRYIAEGLVRGTWREMFEFDTAVCRAGVPASEVDGIYNWRLRAANEHGVGKPSEGAILAHAVDEAVELPLAA